jgi:hypothetical protein
MTATQHDPLIGTWILNPSRSEFGPNHRPQSATLVIKRDDDGRYLVTAEGISEKGQKVAERPEMLIPDGEPRPVPDFPGLTKTCGRPEPRTVQTDVRREDGSLAGQAIFIVSSDGQSLTAINSGFDSQLREFKQKTSWDKR